MDQFLQSKEWAKFQEANGREAAFFDGAFAFVHTLPIVGKYLYFPRYPKSGIKNLESGMKNLIDEATRMSVGWVRVEPETEGVLKKMRGIFQNPSSILPLERGGGFSIVKAPHDMQPRENFVIDISKSEEELFAEMKSKTRYNVRLAEKKGVRVFLAKEEKYREIFFKLLEATARRQNIILHPREYYEKMFTVFPETMFALCIAEYEGRALAANLVIFFGDTATYLHGGTSDEYRETMAPLFLQWEQIREAKRRGCKFYDFGGVSTLQNSKFKIQNSSWEGITRFKMGFSPNTKPVVYPGCYDIILDGKRYWMYDRLRYLQSGLAILKKFLRR